MYKKAKNPAGVGELEIKQSKKSKSSKTKKSF
jgi:hypothetical protein